MSSATKSQTKFEHPLFQEGIAYERERIIKLLEALATHKDCNLGEHHEDYVWNSPEGFIEVLTEWDSEPVALIKGEQDEDACEPSDSPCVNGWSCQKHRKTIEQLIDFLALIEEEK